MTQPRAIVPEKGIRPGINSTGSDIAKWVAVAQTAAGSEDPQEIELPAAGGAIMGIVVSSKVRAGVSPDVGIPDGEIGDIQIEGRAIMLVGAGGLTNGAAVAVTVAGAGVAAGLGDIIVARALEAKSAGEYCEVELTGTQSYVSP